MNLANLLLQAKNVVNMGLATIGSHMTWILTGMGCAGLIGTTVLAVKATPLAMDDIQKESERLGRKLTKKEILKKTWKRYIPAASVGVVSISCMCGATIKGGKEKAALAGLYGVTRDQAAKYQEKVVETIGEKKERKIRDKIYEEETGKNPPPTDMLRSTVLDERIFYFPPGHEYFIATDNRMQKAENAVNRRLLSDFGESLSINEIIDIINEYINVDAHHDRLQHITYGDDRGYRQGDTVEFCYENIYVDGDQTLPRLAVFRFAKEPQLNFRKKIF